MLIRQAHPSEQAALEDLQRRASLNNPGDREALLAHPDAIEVPAEQIAAGRVFVAEHTGTIVGFAAVVPRDDGGAELDALFVEPDEWKRGIGRSLVDHCLHVAHADGASFLHVIGNPHAERFYLACGFTVVGTSSTRFGIGLSMQRDVRGQVDPSPADVQYLEDRIYEFNENTTGITGGEWLSFFERENDRIVAGICGNTWGGTCELRQFWVEESQRGRGLGTKLYEAAEREARRRGCTQIVLMTFSFQAPAFYERNGFHIVATIDNHPRGHQNLLMRKSLE